MTMNQSQRQFSLLSLPGLLLILGVFLTSLTACSEGQPPPPPSKDQPSPAPDQPPPPATEPVTTPATGSLWDNLKDKASGGLTEANTLLDNFKDQAGSSLTDAKNWSTDKLNDTLGELTNALPVIQEAGFEASEIAVTMSLIPTLTLEFKQVKVITPEEQVKILKAHEDQKILSYLLQSLFKIYSLQFGKYKIAFTEIALTVPPTTKVRLSPEPPK